MVFCCLHSHIWIENIVHFTSVCDIHLYSTGHTVQNMGSLMWTQNVYINLNMQDFRMFGLK